MKPNLSLSFSVYNEEENLPELIENALKVGIKFANKFEILIVVYDGSTDQSIKIVKKYENKYKNIRLVLQKKKNKGIGTAYNIGLKHSKYEYLFYSDGDNQFDLMEIKKLIKYIPEYDIVTGYRRYRQDSFGRILAAKVYNSLVRTIFGKTAKDIDCAFRLIKREVIDNINLRCYGGTFTAELLIKAKRDGYKIKDVPVKHMPRTKGNSVFESKIPFPNPRTMYLQVAELKKVWEDIHKGD